MYSTIGRRVGLTFLFGLGNDKQFAKQIINSLKLQLPYPVGVSIMRGQQWIRLNIDVKKNILDFHLSNSKPTEIVNTNSGKGIGLANVQKRLELLYAGKHLVKIESTNHNYSVHLQVTLQHLPAIEQTYRMVPALQPL